MTDEKYNVFIVDCYNLIYRSIEEEQVVNYKEEKFHTEGIIGFLKAMEAYIKKFGTKETKVYWLFDNAKTSVQKFRKSLSEDYKKTRIVHPDWFYKQLDMLELILKSYIDNSYLFRVKFLEADDYVNQIISTYLNEQDRVLLISEDSDWSRALADNVHQYMKGEIYDKEKFLTINGYEATYFNICMFKAFYGDRTDNIKPALKELPLMLFKLIIKDYSSIYDFLQAVKEKTISYIDVNWRLRILRDEELLLLNWNLVEAVDISSSELDNHQHKCKFQEEKLKIYYAALQLLGKVDAKRFPKVENTTDIFEDMLQGMEIGRKKS